jgi:adenylate kinase
MHALVTRKEIHVKLLVDTHAALKVQSCMLKLSMQAIIDELATMVVEEDPYVIRRLKELARRKREREAAALSKTDADTLLDLIEERASKQDD